MQCPRCGRPIDEHEAGRETDACVAEVVMRWRTNMVRTGKFTHDEYYCTQQQTLKIVSVGEWHPSTSIADAWEVVEKAMSKFSMDIEIAWNGYQWFCGLCADQVLRELNTGLETAPTAPLAICRAALKACGGEE